MKNLQKDKIDEMSNSALVALQAIVIDYVVQNLRKGYLDLSNMGKQLSEYLWRWQFQKDHYLEKNNEEALSENLPSYKIYQLTSKLLELSTSYREDEVAYSFCGCLYQFVIFSTWHIEALEASVIKGKDFLFDSDITEAGDHTLIEGLNWAIRCTNNSEQFVDWLNQIIECLIKKHPFAGGDVLGQEVKREDCLKK